MGKKSLASIFNPEKKPVYVGTTLNYLKKGSSLNLARLKKMEDMDSCICSYDIIYTDTIIQIDQISKSIYRVETEKAIYIVFQVL